MTDLKVGGKLSASVQIELSKSAFSAFIWGPMSLTITAYVATKTCYTDGIWPYGCDWQWKHTGFSLTLGTTGFSVTSSGITLEADGYSVTFDYDGHVSVDTADVRRAGSGAGVQGRLAILHTSGHQHTRKGVPVELAATEQPLPSPLATAHPLTPTAHPLTPTGPTWGHWGWREPVRRRRC